MIRQAISCDICGAEKKNTNHWFLATEQGGELRIGPLNVRSRSRPGARHLCGHTCLHKLVDEYMARANGGRAGTGPVALSEAAATLNDISLTARTDERRAQTVAEPRPALVASASPVTLLSPPQLSSAVRTELKPIAAERSVRWRAEAWERERKRESLPAESRREGAARRNRIF